MHKALNMANKKYLSLLDLESRMGLMTNFSSVQKRHIDIYCEDMAITKQTLGSLIEKLQIMVATKADIQLFDEKVALLTSTSLGVNDSDALIASINVFLGKPTKQQKRAGSATSALDDAKD